jgi:hypothetical protein
MHAVADLRELAFAPSRTVIINCGTRLATSLALASAHANTDTAILLIDCESRDDSRAWFARLADRHRLRFDWLEWPLRSHPATLDALFRHVAAETVLLMDSDLELRERRVYDAMSSALAGDPHAYGAGFLHAPQWLGAANGLPPFTGYYAPRMWIPCTLLRTTLVRDAIERGASFSARRIHYEIPGFPTLSRLAGYRFRVRGLRSLRLPRMPGAAGMAAPDIDGRQPRFLEYDTGAALHARLLAEGSRFAALPNSLWGDVAHYHGMTRATLAGTLRRAARRLPLIETGDSVEPARAGGAIRSRLRNAYSIDADDLLHA